MHNIQSPRTGDDAVEQMIQAQASTAPRVTPADIEAVISSEWYFTAYEGSVGAEVEAMRAHDPTKEVSIRPLAASIRHDDRMAQDRLELLTFCVLVLENGFTVTGESACVSAERFNVDIGRKIARENAKNKIWPLLGFRLADAVMQAKEAEHA